MFPQNTIWKMDKMTERDIPEMVALFTQDASIAEGLELSRKEIRNLVAYFEGVLEDTSNGERFYFVSRHRQSAKLMGGISFIQEASSAWERSFWMASVFRGHGYALQLTSAATEWMFTNGMATEIREMTRPDNRPSVRIKKRQGFLLEGLVSSGAGVLRRDTLHPTNFIPQHV